MREVAVSSLTGGLGQYIHSQHIITEAVRYKSYLLTGFDIRKSCHQRVIDFSLKMSDYRDDEDELSDTDDSEPEQQASRAPFDPELDSDDDEGDREDVVSAPAAQTSFSLRGGSLAFSDRSHSIFGGLDSVTQLTSSPLNQGPVTDTEFIQPQPPHPGRKVSQPLPTSPTPPKKRGVPDYLVHPERWTHYSLEDVTETSDQDNRRAAYNFLSSLQQERWRDSSCDIQQRMIFSRPQRLLKEQSSDQLSSDRGKKRRMHLSHLDEGEGEEEEKEEKARGTEQSEEETEEQDTRGAVGQPEEEKQVQTEKDEEGVKPGFTSFRKAKSKNYRRCSDDN